MGGIVLPNGYNLSMPPGNYLFYPLGNTTLGMQTIAETRRARLEELISRHGGMIANLNEALGYERNDTRLARIRNANARTDRPGKVFQMGDPQAREIEETLGLERGWMDTPIGLDHPGMDTEKMRELHRVALELEPYQIDQLIAIGTTLARGPGGAPPAEAAQTHQTTSAGSAAGAGLAAVKSVVAKKIGEGHFGPPADRPDGGKSGRSQKSGRVSGKGHAGRRG